LATSKAGDNHAGGGSNSVGGILGGVDERDGMGTRRRSGRPSIGGAAGGLPGSLSGNLRSSGTPRRNVVATPMRARTPESETVASPSLELDQLASTEPEWIQQNKTPKYRSPMYGEYARRSGSTGGAERSEVGEEGKDEEEEGGMISGGGIGARRRMVVDDNSSPAYVTAGGRSRIVSTAMKQSIWEAELIAARNRSNSEEEQRGAGAGGEGARRSTRADPTSPSL
jgi:hypothetical protein